LLIIFLLQLIKLAGKVLVRREQFPEPDKRPHDLDVHLYGALAMQTLESIATPCSVKAYGSFLIPPQLEVTNCDFKIANSLVLI
jgi:hypothetical protein